MLRVRIDGQNFSNQLGQIQTIGELVELIKASIDPDKMIASMLLNERELSEADWRRSIAGSSECSLEISTDRREKYVMERISQSPLYLKRIVDKFIVARQLYQTGNSFKANQEIKIAVGDLSAYMDWYLTLLCLDSKLDRSFVNLINENVKCISQVCEKIVNYMLCNSWWAVGQALEGELEPQLGKFYESASNFSLAMSKASSIEVGCSGSCQGRR